MANALYISAVGMILVFIGLLLLWLMMAAIVRLTRAKNDAEALPPAPTDPKAALAGADRQRKAAAAATGVAALFAMEKPAPILPMRPKKDSLTPWQVAHRSLQTRTQPPRTRRKE